MVRKTTSIKVDTESWKSVKKKRIDNDQEISDYIEHLMRKDLK